jgi:hypothetical protein
MFTIIFMLGKKRDESTAHLLAINILITVSDVQEEVLLMMLLKTISHSETSATESHCYNYFI